MKETDTDRQTDRQRGSEGARTRGQKLRKSGGESGGEKTKDRER